MKKYLLALLGTGIVVLAPARATPPTQNSPEAYQVQQQLSTLGWIGKKVTGKHNGTLDLQDGQIIVQNEQVVGGTFVFDMHTMKDDDIKDASLNAKLIGHLKSDDFFAVERFPTAVFAIKSVRQTPPDVNGNNAIIFGVMSIKGQQKSLIFPAKVGVKNGLAAASGTATINRTEYDVRYGSKSFFGSIGDKAIDDEFTVSFNVIARK